MNISFASSGQIITPVFSNPWVSYQPRSQVLQNMNGNREVVSLILTCLPQQSGFLLHDDVGRLRTTRTHLLVRQL